MQFMIEFGHRKGHEKMEILKNVVMLKYKDSHIHVVPHPNPLHGSI